MSVCQKQQKRKSNLRLLYNVHLIRFIVTSSFTKWFLDVMMARCILGASDKEMKDRPLSSEMMWSSGEGPEHRTRIWLWQ